MSTKRSGLRVRGGHGSWPAAILLTIVASGGALGAAPAGERQAAGVNQAGPEYIHGQAGSNPMPQGGASEEQVRMEQMRQAERRRRVAMDTAKLRQLSNELKAEVDQSPKDQLSLDVLRKASEIEKTAQDLKNWVKY